MSREELLQAYHDGELSRLARWRFERRLRRSPDLRRELAALERVGDWVRAGHREAAAPDGLWEGVALRLPAVDARRSEGSEARGRGLTWLVPAGALAATAGVVAAVWLGWPEPAASPGSDGVVLWLDGGGRDVLVLESAPDTTIIWVFDGGGTHERV